jgi:hypothetical protein
MRNFSEVFRYFSEVFRFVGVIGSFLFFIFFIIVLGESTLEYLQKFLQFIKYTILQFTPSTAFFHPPTPSFNWYYFCIYIRVYTLFAPYSSYYPIPFYECLFVSTFRSCLSILNSLEMNVINMSDLGA